VTIRYNVLSLLWQQKTRSSVDKCSPQGIDMKQIWDQNGTRPDEK